MYGLAVFWPVPNGRSKTDANPDTLALFVYCGRVSGHRDAYLLMDGTLLLSETKSENIHPRFHRIVDVLILDWPYPDEEC
jgi:hypothetical protein